MNLESILQQFVTLTATLDLRIAASLFIVCAIGEFIVFIPYVLESIWLLVGYQVGAGLLSPLHLIVLWLVVQCGRQAGAMVLYRMGRLGAPQLVRLYHKLHLARLLSSLTGRSGTLSRINLASPFSVAYARLFGMRVPIALTMAVKRRPVTLALGVVLSSIVWDTIYVSLGIVVGTTASIKPVHMLFISFIGITFIYMVTFLLRRMFGRPQSAGDAAL